MEHISPEVWAAAHEIVARAASNSTSSSDSSTAQPARPPVYKAIGLSLAIASGLFIGTSFVLKKKGLLKANVKYNEEAGEGYGYLKNAFWWTGMTLMIVGEICNFVAYAFVDAILVTPLGALSVVVTTILSAIFLKERLSIVGKVGCFLCIIGSVIIVMNAPEQSAVADIQEMKHFVIAPGFLSYAGVIIAGCAFIALWVGPRYGKKTMLVYLSICSLIGGLSVVATQGLGSAIVAQAGGKPQFNQWFLYVLLVFVITTLVTEIIFLNKALNLFNAALVTPTYYVFFTSATIVTSAILFQGFKGTAVTIVTVIMGFLVICSGVVLLQMSKSAKDVPDAAVFKGDLDQVREIAEQEQSETEPKADAIRGAAAIIRRMSQSRQKMEHEEARRLRQETLQDHLEPLKEGETVEWDGLRRRKTVLAGPGTPSVKRKTIHPPLGMSHFPEDGDEQDEERGGHGLFENLRHRTASVLHRDRHDRGHANTDPGPGTLHSPVHPMALTEIKVHPTKVETPILPGGPGSFEEAQEHIYGLPRGLRKDQPSPRSKPLPAKPSTPNSLRAPQEARRQFSFTNILHRHSRTPVDSDSTTPGRPGVSRNESHEQKRAMKGATEEERIGLVKGDSYSQLLATSSPEHKPMEQAQLSRTYSQASSVVSIDDEKYPYHHPSRDLNHSSGSISNEDDEWQNPSPPIPPSNYTYQEVRTITPSPARPAIPPQPQSDSATTPLRPGSRRRPSPPRNYQPPIPQTSDSQYSATSNKTPSSGRTQLRVTPAASDHFPTSLMSQSRVPNFSTAGVGRGQIEEEGGPRIEVADYDDDEQRRRFEEKSKREREERRKRMSWKGGMTPPPGYI